MLAHLEKDKFSESRVAALIIMFRCPIHSLGPYLGMLPLRISHFSDIAGFSKLVGKGSAERLPLATESPS